MTIRELVTVWGFDVNDSQLGKFEKRLGSLKTTVRNLGLFIGGEALALFGLAKTTSEAGEAAEKTAQKVGMTAEKLQELQFAAKMSEVEVETMTMALGLLSAHALKASQGEASSATLFARMGISLRAQNGQFKTTNQLFEETAAYLSKQPEGWAKVATAKELFGRAGAQLLPLLNQGPEGLKKFAAEAHAYGVVLSSGAIRESERFDEALKRLNAMITGLRNTIGVALMPVIRQLISDFSRWFMANRAMIVQNITAFIKEMAVQVKKAWVVIKGFAGFVWGLVQSLGGLGNVLKIVMAGFLLFGAAQAISGIMNLITVVQSLAKAIQMVAFFQALATGGMSILLGLAAAGVAYGGYQYLFGNKVHGDPNADTRGGIKVPMNRYNTVRNVTVNYAPKVDVKTSGDKIKTWDEVANILDKQTRAMAAAVKDNGGQ